MDSISLWRPKYTFFKPIKEQLQQSDKLTLGPVPMINLNCIIEQNIDLHTRNTSNPWKK